jgi:hypothetical protein
MAEHADISIEVSNSPETGAHHGERQEDHDVTIYYTGDSSHANALAAQLKTAGRRALVIEVDLCRFGWDFQ